MQTTTATTTYFYYCSNVRKVSCVGHAASIWKKGNAYRILLGNFCCVDCEGELEMPLYFIEIVYVTTVVAVFKLAFLLKENYSSIFENITSNSNCIYIV
jgi:hypothetical protein